MTIVSKNQGKFNVNLERIKFLVLNKRNGNSKIYFDINLSTTDS